MLRVRVKSRGNLGGVGVGWSSGIVGPSPIPAASLGEGVRDTFCGPDVGQAVLPTPPGGSPASLGRQVNAPLTWSNDLPYVFRVRRFCHGPRVKDHTG